VLLPEPGIPIRMMLERATSSSAVMVTFFMHSI
jgi:hypothetical protein